MQRTGSLVTTHLYYLARGCYRQFVRRFFCMAPVQAMEATTLTDHLFCVLHSQIRAALFSLAYMAHAIHACRLSGKCMQMAVSPQRVPVLDRRAGGLSKSFRPTHVGAAIAARPGLRPRRAHLRAVPVWQANLFSRLVRIVRAYASSFTERFEDPELLLDRVTDEMGEDLVRMRQATAKVK